MKRIPPDTLWIAPPPPSPSALRRRSGLRTSSGVALGLLGVAPLSAEAATPIFVERTGAENPFAGIGLTATPVLVDVDADGDLDVMASTYPGWVDTWRNVGDATTPSFEFIPRGPGHPGPFVPVPGGGVQVSLADLDGDGDPDIIGIEGFGVIRYIPNIGTETEPLFSFPIPYPPPPLSIAATAYPLGQLLDLDADGDSDLVVGDSSRTFRFYENVGDAASFDFVMRTGAQNPFDGLSVPGFGADGDRSIPALGDLDGDGDFDLIAGGYEHDGFLYFENVGSPASPSFVQRTGAANPLEALGLDVLEATAELGDLDGDGDLDMLLFEYPDYRYFEQVEPQAVPISPWTGVAAALAWLFAGWRALRRKS